MNLDLFTRLVISIAVLKGTFVNIEICPLGSPFVITQQASKYKTVNIWTDFLSNPHPLIASDEPCHEETFSCIPDKDI